MEWREQRLLVAFGRLIIGPKTVAERLDDVIGRYPDVRRSLLDHLQHGVQYADHGAEPLVLAFGGVAPAVELAEQLVRAVDQMDDHADLSAAADDQDDRGERAPRAGGLPRAKTLAEADPRQQHRAGGAARGP